MVSLPENIIQTDKDRIPPGEEPLPPPLLCGEDLLAAGGGVPRAWTLLTEQSPFGGIFLPPTFTLAYYLHTETPSSLNTAAIL